MRRLFTVLAVLAIAALSFVPAGAVPSGSHVIAGVGSNGTDTLQILAFESSSSGSALLNGSIPITITCVSVQPPPTTPGFHKVYLAGNGGGALWFFEIGDSPSGDALGVTNVPNFSFPCGVLVAAQTVTTGGFTVAP